jgi:hypothetical protein
MIYNFISVARLVVAIIASAALVACETMADSEDVARIKTVGIISVAGSPLELRYFGPFRYSWKELDISDWGLDAAITESIRDALTGHFEVRAIEFDSSKFGRTPSPGESFLSEHERVVRSIRETARPADGGRPVDAYVLVYQEVSADPYGTNGPLTGGGLRGLGIYNRSHPLIGRAMAVYASVSIAVIDGQDFGLIAASGGQRSHWEDVNDSNFWITVETPFGAEASTELAPQQIQGMKEAFRIKLQKDLRPLLQRIRFIP